MYVTDKKPTATSGTHPEVEEKKPKANTILVVEDEALSRDMLVRRLVSRGFNTLSAENGLECLDWIEKQGAPDLILMDVNMPGLSGLEVIKLLRRDFSRDGLPIIMVSALSDSDDVIAGLESGANDYVVKPVTFPVLLARMRSCLELKAAVGKLIGVEQQRVMMESLGAACHHIAQPMTTVLTSLEMLERTPLDHPEALRGELSTIIGYTRQVAKLLHRLQGTRRYATETYAGDARILDLSASEEDVLTGT